MASPCLLQNKEKTMQENKRFQRIVLHIFLVQSHRQHQKVVAKNNKYQ